MMTYPIPNNLEVLGQDIVAMVDDFTLAGNISSVSAHASKIYVIERTPRPPFDFLQVVRARDKPEDAPINITIQETPANRHSSLEQFTLMCDMPATQVNPNGGTMVFYPDDSGLNLVGHL